SLSYLFRQGNFDAGSPGYGRMCRGCALASAVHYIQIMRLWLSIVPVLLLAGCSRTQNPWPTTQVAAGANPATESAPLAPLAPKAVIPSGTPLHVRVDELIDTRRNRAGDGFSATLSEPIQVDGQTMVPEGTGFSGHITTAAASGRLKGRAFIGLKLDSFTLNGREYLVETSSVQRASASHKKRNALLIGGGAGLGAALGALAGGGKGALIGAGAGAGAGTAGAAATGRRQVGIGAETPLRFTLRTSVEM